jgi:hypothetical protein
MYCPIAFIFKHTHTEYSTIYMATGFAMVKYIEMLRHLSRIHAYIRTFLYFRMYENWLTKIHILLVHMTNNTKENIQTWIRNSGSGGCSACMYSTLFQMSRALHAHALAEIIS